MIKSADLSSLGKGVLPPGYIVVSMAQYPGGVSPFGKVLGYNASVQVGHEDLFKNVPGADPTIYRGAGDDLEAALESVALQITKA